MSSERCLYTIVPAPRGRHEEILRELVAPLVHELGDSPHLDSLFFARYNKPDWEVRFRILGRSEWVDGPVRERVGRRVAELRERGLLDQVGYARYEREYDRYGGPEGMRLAERIFHRDTVACIELIEADARGLLAKSRREYSLMFSERFLDLLRFDRKRRIAYYRFAYSWAVEQGTWEEEEMRVLEERYRSLKDGLLDLLRRDPIRDSSSLWGGAEPARIAERCLEATRPDVEELLAAHAAGRVRQDLVHLAWSLTHMHCNRLGVEATAEAILRYFMHRLHEEEEVGAA